MSLLSLCKIIDLTGISAYFGVDSRRKLRCGRKTSGQRHRCKCCLLLQQVHIANYSVFISVKSLSLHRRCIHLAAAEGHLDVLQLLVERKADFNAVDRWGSRPLDDARRGGHTAVLEYLLSIGAIGRSEAAAGDSSSVNGGAEQIAFDGGAESDTSEEGLFPDPKDHATGQPTLAWRLCRAAALGDTAAVEALLAARADANATTYNARTALHLAASEGHAAVVACLLRHGADAGRRDRWGSEPLKDAIWCGHEAAQALLAEAAAAAGRPRALEEWREVVEVGRPLRAECGAACARRPPPFLHSHAAALRLPPPPLTQLALLPCGKIPGTLSRGWLQNCRALIREPPPPSLLNRQGP